MNPNMPKTGEQIFCIAIKNGKLEVTQVGTVLERSGVTLTTEEYWTSQGSRYSMGHFWPGGEPGFVFNLERWPHDSAWMNCTESGKLGALDRLKTEYVHRAIIAEQNLQSRARLLHDYASAAQDIQL